ncbi:translation initiation factor IF-2 subunit gamma [Candidatus Woesearchaeota archaeon]|nr:translation initiation factor IF-2 subunit gamma [Candidatus Woesearchaeota archaeon]
MAKKRAESTKAVEKVEKPKADVSQTEHSPSGQPQINIGMFGHVDHGKTTLVRSLSGKWTDTHSEEIKRGITIRLGYADVDFYRCGSCKGYDAYGTTEGCKGCMGKAQFLRKVSLVDAPGHESLMATMLAGATIIDCALLLVSAAEECPQPQTREHLMALQILGVKKVIVVQNKIDLVNEEKATKNYEQIKAFLKGSEFENAPIIPVSGQHGVNVDILIGTIEQVVSTPARKLDADPLMFVARSFDINKPGTKIGKLVGGVLGGSMTQGQLKVGDDITIAPGYEVEEKNKKVWKPLQAKVEGLMTGGHKVDVLTPGGSAAVLTTLDPSVVKSDKLTGAVVGHPDKLPPVWYGLKLETHLLERVVGTKEDIVVEALKPAEPLMLNVNCAATVGIITELGRGTISCTLKLPVCATKGSRVTISRRVGNRFRLIGYGIIKE